MDIKNILQQAEANTVFYVCGPLSLISQVLELAEALGIDAENIRFERFNSDIANSAKAVTVHLKRSNMSLDVKKDESILDAMLDAGIPAAYSCKTGACKSCVVKVVDGVADHQDMALSEDEKTQQKLMCPCVSRAKTDNLVLDI
jgi:ferredoxin